MNLHLYLYVIIFLAFLAGCSSENGLKEKNQAKSNNDIAFVYNTFKDVDEPWLSVRREASQEGEVVYMLTDGTQVEILPDSNNNSQFVKVRIIQAEGYVSKAYLTKDSSALNKPGTLLAISQSILENLQKRNYDVLLKYMHDKSFRFFYWNVSKNQLLNGSFKNLPDVYSDDGASDNLYRESIKKYMIFDRWANHIFVDAGVNYFPAAGFGGGSVEVAKSDEYVIRCIDPEAEQSLSELWFKFKMVNGRFKLVEIGDWGWTP
jgi:hypothetical protein